MKSYNKLGVLSLKQEKTYLIPVFDSFRCIKFSKKVKKHLFKETEYLFSETCLEFGVPYYISEFNTSSSYYVDIIEI